MKAFKITLFSIFIILSISKSKAQFNGGNTTIDLTIFDSRNINVEPYSEVKGLPYLFKDWAKGSVRAGSSEKKDLMLKYDEVEDRVFVKGPNGELSTFSTQLTGFSIQDPSKNNIRNFSAGFLAVNTFSEKSFYEVLVNGKAKFLRKNIKVISENKEYSGAIVKSVNDDIRYFLVLANNQPVMVKLEPKAILEVLKDKETELNNYIKTNNLNLKKLDDASKLITYYNTL